VDILKLNLLAVEDDLSFKFIVRIDTTQDLHQCGLAGAVLPNQTVDFSATHGKVHVVQGTNAREGLGDMPHF
jgi:hypothetical protein